MSDLVAPIPECDGQAQAAPGAGPGHHSHPWEILSSLPDAEQKQFRENFSRLCLPHQRLVFRKLLTRPAYQKRTGYQKTSRMTMELVYGLIRKKETSSWILY